MIAWRDHWSLLALLLVPLVGAFLVWAERRRRRDLVRFVEAGLLATVVPDLDPRRRRLRHAVRLLGLGCLGLALAGPQWGFRWQEVRREGIDLVVALDTSRSMLATDIKPSRLARAKLALRDLLGQMGGDRIALVAFAGTAFVQCPLTLDHGIFSESLEAVDTDLIPRGGTSITAAIDASLEAFEGRQSQHQAIVLITDGEDHEGDVEAAAARAAERGVKVYTVGIGTPDGELIPAPTGGWLKDRQGQVVKSRLDETTLQEVAVSTGGVYVHASGPSLGLPDLYRDYVAAMERRELESTLERRWEHRFQWPLALALVVLVLEPWIRERRRVTGPVVMACLALLGVAEGAAAWPGDADPARAAAAAYDDGDFDAAAEGYNQALIDDPDSVRLHFNLGAAEYRRGQWERAASTLEAALRDAADPVRVARIAYNLGNVRFREGDAVSGAEPQRALDRWAAALVAYRRALGADPDFEDVKYNYELVQRRIERLREELEQEQDSQTDEEQQQPSEQPQDGQEQPQTQPSQPEEQPGAPDEQAAGGEENGSGEEDPTPQASEDEARPEAGEPAPAPTAGAEARDGMTPEEAAALLDAQRGEEIDPREMRRGSVAAEAAPLRDW